MDTFQITVLSIATIVLFGILIVVGMLMRKEGKSVPFPPVSTDCPDGWTQNGKMCIPDVSNKGILKDISEVMPPDGGRARKKGTRRQMRTSRRQMRSSRRHSNK